VHNCPGCQSNAHLPGLEEQHANGNGNENGEQMEVEAVAA
jgi:hypothetical protein